MSNGSAKLNKFNKFGPVIHNRQGYTVRIIPEMFSFIKQSSKQQIQMRGDSGKYGIYKGKVLVQSFERKQYPFDRKAMNEIIDNLIKGQVFKVAQAKKEANQKNRRSWEHVQLPEKIQQQLQIKKRK